MLRSLTGVCLFALPFVCGYAIIFAFFAFFAAKQEPGTPTAIESERTAYSRGHSGKYTQWVQYTLTPASLRGKAPERPGNFTEDDRQPKEFRWGEADYVGSGYDIGHLCEAAAVRGEGKEHETFIITNTAPQHPALNRGQWAQLERYVRNRAKACDKATVVVGVALLPEVDGVIRIKTIGRNQLQVPTHFWKAALFSKGNEMQAMAWLIPNEGIDDFRHFQRSVDFVESEIGFDLFPGLDEALEKTISIERKTGALDERFR